MPIVIPYTKQTWVDGAGGGTPVSAARLGVVEEGILDVSQAPAVRVYNNADQSIASATPTALAFNNERFDQAGGVASTHHDTVTNNSRLTCLYAGIYLITGNIEFQANTTGYREVDIKLNNVTTIFSSIQLAASGSLPSRLHAACIYQLAVNDYVQLIAIHNAGVGVWVSGTSTGNYSPEFGMTRIA